MATTGFTFKGKFYAFGSKDMPKELLDSLKERGLDVNGKPLTTAPPAPATGQHPMDKVKVAEVKTAVSIKAVK